MSKKNRVTPFKNVNFTLSRGLWSFYLRLHELGLADLQGSHSARVDEFVYMECKRILGEAWDRAGKLTADKKNRDDYREGCFLRETLDSIHHIPSPAPRRRGKHPKDEVFTDNEIGGTGERGARITTAKTEAEKEGVFDE